MIDLHCHVLPGIDDGPQTIEEALELARGASSAGTSTIVATPHVSARYPNDAATIARLVGELNGRLRAEGIAIEVLPGAEIALTSAVEMDPERLAELGLGGAGGRLLIEPPFTPSAGGIDAIVLDIMRGGHRVVLAHPERCPAFHRDRAVLESLVRAGALTSITAGSLVGRFGGEVRRFALALVRDGLVHNVASDAHDHLNRPPGIAAELRQARLEALTEWFTEQVPAAILSGEEIPPAPADAIEELQSRPERGQWWRPRRRG
jgi:protein-tyrosine phosphatase